jgi:hypothetical protein
LGTMECYVGAQIWLDSRQDSEHHVSRRVEKDEAQQARRRRRNDMVDLASRHEDGYQCGQLGVDN